MADFESIYYRHYYPFYRIGISSLVVKKLRFKIGMGPTPGAQNWLWWNSKILETHVVKITEFFLEMQPSNLKVIRCLKTPSPTNSEMPCSWLFEAICMWVWQTAAVFVFAILYGMRHHAKRNNCCFQVTGSTCSCCAELFTTVRTWFKVFRPLQGKKEGQRFRA